MSITHLSGRVETVRRADTRCHAISRGPLDRYRGDGIYSAHTPRCAEQTWPTAGPLAAQTGEEEVDLVGRGEPLTNPAVAGRNQTIASAVPHLSSADGPTSGRSRAR